ncbi:GNAT family N-acetyltransferase [Leucobacter sp. cx-42]|uniref:GNAT family N-acetyltransferase n=1 Tax=unclassified Leucobacter TaxID=2621730 RepID=UPI00165D36A3|nr:MULTISPECIES: GNAT family N-acetyltransferase [unclassified Leucobacter]MBC9955070.1 GNAT family N-acetyltransferase [Leucobacter sp. cx-42]
MSEPTAATLVIRPVAAGDQAGWAALYRGYRDFYKREHNPEVYETVWGWLEDPAHEVRGLVAELDGELVGLGHFRTFARPLDGVTALFLDDLFTSPAARGKGAATQILDELARIARREGAALVRWITAEDNATAKRLYDSLAARVPFDTYDMQPAALPGASA